MKGYNEMHLSQESMKEIVQDWINKSYTVYNASGTRRQVIKSDAMARTRREHDLAIAIERTQLPHETTIHERIMPYRVRE